MRYLINTNLVLLKRALIAP